MERVDSSNNVSRSIAQYDRERFSVKFFRCPKPASCKALLRVLSENLAPSKTKVSRNSNFLEFSNRGSRMNGSL